MGGSHSKQAGFKGKGIGNILNKLLDMVIREDIKNNREELLNTIDEIQMQRMWQ